MLIVKIIIVWTLVNVLLHLLLLKPNGEIEALYYEKDNDIASYFIPGINAPPREVFEAYVASMAGNVYLVNHSHFGFNPTLLAHQIKAHIRSHRYTKSNIYAISVGCKVAQKLEKSTSNSVLLNPCLKPVHLKTGLRVLLSIITPILMLLRFVLGVLADLPIIPIDGMWRSLAENIEQLFYIAWIPYDIPRNVRGVILSQADQFLNNREIIRDLDNDSRKQLSTKGTEDAKKQVSHVKNVVLADIGHADIRNKAYLELGRELGIFK